MDGRSENLTISFARKVDAPAPGREPLRLPDGYITSVYIHDPAQGPKGAPVVYLHGIQSHPGWFVGSAAALAARGRRVFQVARRGSGDNRLDRGHAQSARQLLDDVEAACRFALDHSDFGKVHLVGVSWGGKLAACYACRPGRQVELASLTMVAPGIAAQVDVGPGGRLLIGLSLLICPRRSFGLPLGDVGLFTDNEQMRRYLRDDPCRLHRATARFLFSSRQLDRLLRQAPDGCLDTPATLILAGRDRIIDNAKTQAVLARLAGNGLRVALLSGAHTLEFEPDPQPLYGTITDAIERAESTLR